MAERGWRAGQRRHADGRDYNVLINIEYMKASVRSKVEHPLRIIKCQFRSTKASYRGLTKNDSKLAMLFALANIVRVGQMNKARGNEYNGEVNL